MLDHIGLTVSDLARSKAFYDAALHALAIGILFEFEAAQTGGDAHVGFGTNGRAFFWIGGGDRLVSGAHIAFVAPSRAAVAAFYVAALQAGGRDNGPPGIRPYYHPDYYAAFVLDPDGNNIEAVCRDPA